MTANNYLPKFTKDPFYIRNAYPASVRDMYAYYLLANKGKRDLLEMDEYLETQIDNLFPDKIEIGNKCIDMNSDEYQQFLNKNYRKIRSSLIRKKYRAEMIDFYFYKEAAEMFKAAHKL